MMRDTPQLLRDVLALLVLTAALPASVRPQDAAVARKPAATSLTIVGDVSYVSFSGATDPWRLASVALSRPSSAGTFIVRVNYANRFALDGVQVEADAYPRVNEKVYLYLNAGYSNAAVFPEWRGGGEVFTSLPGTWEASAGFRQLRFVGESVTLLTGTVGKYLGNYWLSLRPYLRSGDGLLSASAGLTARRYFADGDHWVGASASYGNSPTDHITPDAVGRAHALSLSVNGSTGLSPRLLATWLLGHDAEELTPGNTRTSTTVTAGLRFSF